MKRDGTNVVTDKSCKATSGHWISPYDGVATDLESDLDIVRFSSSSSNDKIYNVVLLKDHLVPLKEAWISGARSWTAEQREAYANDLTRPQLVAVTDNLNQSKSTYC